MRVRLAVVALTVLLGGALLPNRVEGQSGLEVGDRFSIEINFSNSWEEVAILVPRRAGEQRRITPRSLEEMRANAFEAIRPIAQDPLFVDMVLHGQVLESGALELSPDISRVHYFDDRNRRWTIEPKKKGARARAEQLVEDVAFAWRRDFRSRLEREMLEEQLLGAALVLLHEAQFLFELGEDLDPRLDGLDAAMTDHLPETFPRVLRESVTWFFREAVQRITAPQRNAGPAEWIQGSKFEAGGMPFQVVKVGRKGGDKYVAVQGYIHRPKVGVSTREHAVFFPGTGLVVDAQTLTFHEAVSGESCRFGAVKWRSKLVDFKRATKTEPAKSK